ncbi:hypothetical protein HN840_01920 [archaeon]|jgi:hypothetical protein|nr:hypothetical protein [archaeon]MBT3730488.1 hypothetical protein [archaeon]MBT4669446.1 hypothetical protein [archaeon]MBT5029801.1 hypothetical protein [archaeon]MBT5288014.1 hypothetical protein [archaeon]
MEDNFVYIVCDDRSTYDVRFRSSLKDFVTDKDMIDRLGYEMIKCYRVCRSSFCNAMDNCQSFVDKNISLGDLELRMQER